MSQFEEKNQRNIFELQKKGDTLVISPKGDAVGFSHRLFQKEQDDLLGILESPEIDHLIIDFGNSKYFGSEMIGAVNQLIIKVRDTGGKTGVCNLSVDMQEGIHVMQLDKLWTIYETRKDALKDIATQSISKTIEHQIDANRSRLFILGIVALVIASVLVGLFISARNENRRHYNTLMANWNALDSTLITSGSVAEKRLAVRSALDEVRTIVTSLRKRSSKRSAGENKLYAASKRLEVLLIQILPPSGPFKKVGNEEKITPDLKGKTPEELKEEFVKLMQSAHEQFGWDQGN